MLAQRVTREDIWLGEEPERRLRVAPEPYVRVGVGHDEEAVWGAVGRTTGGTGFETHDAAWRRFDADTSRDGLFVVADAYPNVRLWCNTEPAFWLLAEPDIFASNSPS